MSYKGTTPLLYSSPFGINLYEKDNNDSGVVPPPPLPNYLLLETGDFLLLETGFFLELEN